MKFNLEQSRSFGDVLDRLVRLTEAKTQLKLIDKLGLQDISPSDLSKAKGGVAFGDEKWKEMERKIAAFLSGLVSAGRAVKEAEQIRAMLAKLNETPEPSEFQIAQGDVPADPDLRKALLALECNRQVNSDLWELLDTNEIQLVAASYADGIRDMMASLQEKIGEINDRARGKDKREISGLGPEESDFGRIIRWASAQSRPLLCLFPFFLTSHRRLAWGVIRYAWQKQIGLVVPTFLVNSLVKERATEHGVTTIRVAGWETLLRRKADIYSLVGYATEEILCEVTLRADGADKRDLIHRFNEHNRPLFQELNKDAIEKATEPGVNVFAFDLADEATVRGLMGTKRGFEIVQLDHGLSIPVGIGFSLPLFPWIKDHFQELREAALGAIDSKTEDYLLKVGIEVDRRTYRKR